MGADQHRELRSSPRSSPLRPVSHRGPPHRWSEDGTVQLALRAGAGGALVLRIEDTDRERSTPENVEQILDALRWLELDWDEGPLSQYERSDRHRERVEELLASGRAYRDSATGEDVAAWKKEHGNRGYRGEPSDDPGAAVRLRVPDEGDTVVLDETRGEVRFPNETSDDFVIARGDGSASTTSPSRWTTGTWGSPT